MVEAWPFSPIHILEDNSANGIITIADDSCVSRVSFFQRALVGRVGGVGSSPPPFNRLKEWVKQFWGPFSRVVVRDLNDSLFCFIFASEREAEHILKMKK